MKTVCCLIGFLVWVSMLSAQQLIRGPYLSSATPSGICITWRTNQPCNSKVQFGHQPGSFQGGVVDNNLTTEHVVVVNGLQNDQLYFYTIGSSTLLLQGDSQNYFRTLPLPDSLYEQPIRLIAVGDAAKATPNEARMRNALLQYTAQQEVRGYLMLGDNSYPSGLDSNYQQGFFDFFQSTITKHTVLWPALGNHEYNNDYTLRRTHTIPYFDVFTLPVSGESGGVASHTERYYAFNIGNVHCVQLDSYGLEEVGGQYYGLADTVNSPQIAWLKQNLDSNKLPWVLVSFHHPPYCMGTHNSDTEADLALIRQQVIPILERYNVDLVLNGHSHTYERSCFMHHHYGDEASYNATLHRVQDGSAKEDGSPASCPYIKHTGTSGAVDSGTVYAVIGSGSAVPQPPQLTWPHAAMYYSNYLDNGCLLLTIEGNRLMGEWISTDTSQVVKDRFVLYKNVNRLHHLQGTLGQTLAITPGWKGPHTYIWNTADSTAILNWAILHDTVLWVHDSLSCLSDTFYLKLVQPMEVYEPGHTEISLYPDPVNTSCTLRGLPAGRNQVIVYNAYGQALWQEERDIREGEVWTIETSTWCQGLYLLRWRHADGHDGYQLFSKGAEGNF